jgi:hypothetical protein
MTTALPYRVLSLIAPLLMACEASPPTESDPLLEPAFHAFANSGWSEPVNLGAPVNSPCQDQTPTLSKDELALYFLSDRPGGMGNLLPTGCQDNFDLRVAQRASRRSSWELAVNLGPVIN